MNFSHFKVLWIVVALWGFTSCTKDDPEPQLPELPDIEDSTFFGIAAVDDPILDFMGRYNIPGASVAISRNGRLVYAKGYGWADRETATPVDTSSLFRIASLSKFVTSVGIMTLIDKGQLNMNDKVFGPGSILGTEFGTQPYRTHITDITLRNLLQHEIGGWNNSSGDPAFQQTSLSARQLISWTIDNRPLTATPGTKLDYSNIGYIILSQIIEKVSGKPYDQYIKEDVLRRVGVENMDLAGDRITDRKPYEVKYYGQNGQNPYGYALGIFPRLSGAGGWVASAIDYLRLVAHVDGLPTPPDILTPATVEIMSTPSNNSVYASGIRISATQRNWWHGGGIAGTRTWMVKASNGFAWTIFFNTRSMEAGFDNAVNELVWPAVNNAATPWPDVDLF